jgi:filamentous hemagglutinin family protein
MMQSGDCTRRIGTRRRKLGLYSTVSVAGLGMIMLGATPARAQIHAIGTARTNTSTGSASATLNNSSSSPIIQVMAPQAIIDWAPSDNQFLPAGTTATFYNLTSGSYTVLNVIASGTTPMRFDGSVVSRIGGPTGTPGGNVWFYSPGGIIVGSGASFDVGSLLLTTLNPDPGNAPGQPFAGFNDGQNGMIGFQTDAAIWGSGNNSSQISIASGATITAQNYVGIVAPRIVQNGTIDALGAVGLIAGESANLSISLDGGLFEISVPTGTNYQGDASDPANAAIVNGGTISGGARPVNIAARSMYMVAVPKNVAVSMLLGGTIGYADSATAADDGVLVLAGSNVSAHFDGSGVVSWSAPQQSSLPGTIQIGGSTAANDTLFGVRLNAIGTNVITTASDHDITFAHHALLFGTVASTLDIGTGRTVTAADGLEITSSVFNIANNSFGGRASATIATGGTLRLATGTTLTIDASGLGLDALDSGTNSGFGGTVTGGSATLAINGGTLEGLAPGNSGGAVRVAADGIGGAGNTSSGPGGGGSGFAGAAEVTLDGGTLNASALTVSAKGTGGSALASGGDAQGGTVSLSATNGGHIAAASGYTLTSLATGGNSTNAPGAADGGTITVSVTNNSLVDSSSGSPSRFTSTGTGGSDSSFSVTGGTGTAGAQTITIAGNSALNLRGLNMQAFGQGGSGTGSSGIGADLTISIDNSTFSANFVSSGTSALVMYNHGQGAGGGGSIAGNTTLIANAGAFLVTGGIDAYSGGTDTGGSITIATTGDGSAANAVASRVIGTTTLDNTVSNIGTGTITVRNAMTGTADPLSFDDLNIYSSTSGGPAAILLESGSNQVGAANTFLRSDRAIAISALSPTGGIVSTGSFYASSPSAITVSAASDTVAAITARSIELNYSNIDTRGALLVANGDGSLGGSDGTVTLGSFTLAQVGNVRATLGIDVTATGGITIGNASVSAAPVSDGSGGIDQSVGYIRLTAGDYTGPNDGRNTDPSAGITIAGALSATGFLGVTAPNSVTVSGTGALLSDNGIDLQIGNDLTVSAGGLVSAVRNPLAGSTSDLTLNLTGFDSANSLINAGTITSNSRPLQITANAIDSTGGTFGGSSVTVGVIQTDFSGNDNGQLASGCFVGSICLGSVITPGALTIDTSSLTPATVTLGGAITADSLNIAAQTGVTLGTSGVAADITIANGIAIDAGSGAITGIGSGTVRSGAGMLLSPSTRTFWLPATPFRRPVVISCSACPEASSWQGSPARAVSASSILCWASRPASP